MLTLPPVKGEISLAGVLPLAGVGGSSRTRVVVEYIIILIIINVVVIDSAQLQLCQTVHLESSFFQTFNFPSQSDGPADRPLVLLARFPMASRVESAFCPPKFNSRRGR